MCGIFGYIGDKDAYNEVFNGLSELQYRGYDSCGIAYFVDGNFKINKTVGTLSNLEHNITLSHTAFGHTRWATNGEVNIQNTHPHISHDGEFIVVHNGIINNADILKHNLQKNGISFYSNTDTEVIANLLADMTGSIDDRVKSLFNILNGSFSLIIGHKDGDIYLVKQFSPLNLLVNNSGIYVSSDVSSLTDGELYRLEDGDAIKISDRHIINLNNREIEFEPHGNDIETHDLGKFNHYMIKEIFEIPETIKNTYNYLKYQNIRSIFKPFNRFTLLGCGTAYHSCLIGEHLLKQNHFDVESCLASNYEINDKIKKNHLHIIVSQSGETADCIKVAERIKSNNGKILLITNQVRSTLSRFADYQILTKAKKELAVASTKTYCAQVFTFAYIVKLMNDKNYNLDIDNLVGELSNFIRHINVQDIVKTLSNTDKLIMVAKNIDYLTLLEASLKIREIDYIYTLPMYSGELKHGTLSLIDENSYTILLNTSNDIDKLKTVMNEISSRKGRVIDMSKTCNINSGIDDYFKPIFNIIPFQILSYELAISRGINPDMPRNLAKSVTVE